MSFSNFLQQSFDQLQVPNLFCHSLPNEPRSIHQDEKLGRVPRLHQVQVPRPELVIQIINTPISRLLVSVPSCTVQCFNTTTDTNTTNTTPGSGDCRRTWSMRISCGNS